MYFNCFKTWPVSNSCNFAQGIALIIFIATNYGYIFSMMQSKWYKAQERIMEPKALSVRNYSQMNLVFGNSN